MLELKKGGKRVKWKEISNRNSWYIDESFLLDGRILCNPTRLSEGDLRAYWEHWYHLEDSGTGFTFKRVGSYNPDQDEKSEGPQTRDDEEEQPGEADTPRHCKSDKEKIQFLRALLGQFEKPYHSLISAIAAMEVCYLLQFML